MKRFFCTLLVALTVASTAFSQTEDDIKAANEAAIAQNDIVKKGISFGPFPIVGFDQNKGFQFGALCNIYNFGDGSWYPTPKSQWYLEASFFTQGSMLFIINYDNKTLIPGVRMCIGATFNDNKALDFFGFNGYAQHIETDLPSSYYKMSRLVPCFKADFTGKIYKHLYWKAGYQFKYFKTGSHEPKDGPVPTLFDEYVNMGYIDPDEVDGGFTSSVRAGIMYDSRDFEAEPTRGIWAEADIEGAPKWLGTSVPYAKYVLIFRNYLPIVKKKLVFAYRLSLQGFFNDPAYYVLPFESQLGYGYDRDGFGGYRNVRGLVGNRLQGRSVFYFNTELRYHFVDFHLWKQNIGLALNAFCDGGSAIVPFGNRPSDDRETIHPAVGGGFRIIVNRNFVIAADYGVPLNRQDCPIGKGGSFYINTGFLF